MPSTIQTLDQAHHLHPFTNLRQFKSAETLVIDRADGIYIYDEQGKRYLDGMAGLWCVNVGYGRTELAAVAQRQMATLPYYNTFFESTTAPTAQLADKLTDLAPANINHVFFANSGSEANDTIVRLMRLYWEAVGQPSKKAIISCHGSYHGSTLVGASLCGFDYMHPTADLPLPDFYHIDQPYYYQDGGSLDEATYGIEMARRLEQLILQLGAENVAAFHTDTIASGSGVIVPPDSYWPEIVRICERYDVLLSIDEVITGFGRIGAWFSAELYDLQPDFIATAKGLSSGYMPISAALVSDRVTQGLLASNITLNHGFTYSGHPTAAAVALENIRILAEEKLVDKVANETGPYLMQQLNTLTDHPLVGDVRGRGLLAAVELVTDDAPQPDAMGGVGKTCFAHCLQLGLIARPIGDTMAFAPPLIIERDQIDEMITTFRQALDLTLESKQAFTKVAARSRRNNDEADLRRLPSSPRRRTS